MKLFTSVVLSCWLLTCANQPGTNSPKAAPQGDRCWTKDAKESKTEAKESPRPQDPQVQAILSSPLAQQGWTKLQHLTDRIGARISGSPQLEQAYAWAKKEMEQDGFDVIMQPVKVNYWKRGPETAQLTAPVRRNLPVLGLGNSVPTKGELTAEVISIRSFDELKKRSADVQGKIVLYNVAMPTYHPDKGSGYGDVSAYRVGGPSAAAKYGAKAVLMRSVTAHSLHTLHTGTLWYDDKSPKLPAAAITTEHADLLQRLIDQGDTVKVALNLSSQMIKNKTSHNLITDLKGSESPDNIILIGCHLDSWDVGQGAHDDGAGCVIMMQALIMLKRLELVPKKTIRLVLFTNEENGSRGAEAYAKKYGNDKHEVAIESDSGAFAPRGFTVEKHPEALALLRKLASNWSSIGAQEVEPGYGGADITPLGKYGTARVGLWVKMDTYFDIHHTEADTLDKVDPKALADNIKLMAVASWLLANN